MDLTSPLPPRNMESPRVRLGSVGEWGFSEHQQADCRMDGELEGDARDPDWRRPLLGTQDLFEDHHLRRHREAHHHLLLGQERG